MSGPAKYFKPKTRLEKANQLLRIAQEEEALVRAMSPEEAHAALRAFIDRIVESMRRPVVGSRR